MTYNRVVNCNSVTLAILLFPKQILRCTQFLYRIVERILIIPGWWHHMLLIIYRKVNSKSQYK